MHLVELRNMTKTYRMGSREVHALRPLNLTIDEGRFIAIMGASGSGKSTLLNVLGMLDRPTSGEYFLEGDNVANLDDNTRSEIRCRKIGIVFQSFNLFNQFTVIENVCIPMRYANVPKVEMYDRAEQLLDSLGLADRRNHRPNQLSGGQCQRVAIARSLANNPAVLLADEPTGNLDEKTGNEVLEVFHQLVSDGRTVIMVTHNPEYRDVVEYTIDLQDGRVVGHNVMRERVQEPMLV